MVKTIKHEKRKYERLAVNQKATEKGEERIKFKKNKRSQKKRNQQGKRK